MKAKEFDKKFDKDSDISKHLDVSKASSPMNDNALAVFENYKIRRH